MTSSARQSINWGQAFAEVVFIFIGVGIALLADNWVDDQREIREETQYLVSLRSDFEETRLNLIQTLEAVRENRDLKLRFLELLQGPTDSLSEDELSELIRLAFYMQMPSATLATYNDMVNSGDLRLLRNSELRLRLAEFDSKWDDYEAIIVEGFEQWNQLHVPFLVHNTSVPSVYSSGYEGIEFPGDVQPIDRTKIWSQEFENIIAISVISRQDMIYVGQHMQQRVDQVLNLIEESLQ